MKICRVKEIVNIGTFANCCGCGSVGFEKLTFIYGLNTFGKTTLTDIFQSIKSNINTPLLLRKTIPLQSSEQKIVIGIKAGETESDLIYRSNIWQNNMISTNLEVFGSNFIHDNLFSGLTIERRNKERLTQFILGEEGVKLATEIAEEKKKLGELKRSIPQLIPLFVKQSNEDEINKFIEHPIDLLNQAKIEGEISELKIKLAKEESRLNAPQIILNKPDIPTIDPINIQLMMLVNEVNKLLYNDYRSINDDALKLLESHIQNNFDNKNNAENWIKEGLNYCKDGATGNCSFCGQSLATVADLMKSYSSYFDSNYIGFISNTQSQLSSKIISIESYKISCKSQMLEIQIRLKEYEGLIESEPFKQAVASFKNEILKLNEESIEKHKSECLVDLKKLSDKKIQKPYISLIGANTALLKSAIINYTNSHDIIRESLFTISKCVSEFKEAYRKSDESEQQIKVISNEIISLEYSKERIRQDTDCKEYKKVREQIKLLERLIKTKVKQLQDNQTNYLSLYFTKINELFKRFGSRNFTLEKNEDNRGHQPVYSLKVKYHNIEITDDQLASVFSESDRRALGLAIFWARIDLKDDASKKEMVVILDDPMTSFDENRMTNSIELFKDYLEKVSQIIILTHYPNFIKRFCEITKSAETTTKFIKLCKDGTTSKLEPENRSTFTDSQFEQTYSKISGFINRTHSDSIKSDLRPFLENLYIPVFFASHIEKAKAENRDISTLENIIEYVFNDNPIAKAKFHEFRKVGNPDHHVFTSNNDEDVRNFAEEMMNYLYSFNF